MPFFLNSLVKRIPFSINQVSRTCGDECWIKSDSGWLYFGFKKVLKPPWLTRQHFHKLPRLAQLLLGLNEIATICPEQGLLLTDKCKCIGATKSRNKVDPFIPCSQVFALMLVGPRQNVAS